MEIIDGKFFRGNIKKGGLASLSDFFKYGQRCWKANFMLIQNHIP